MGYRSEIYSKALKLKKDAVKSEQRRYEAELEALRRQNKEFAQFEAELGSIGPALALTAISGDEEKLSRLKAICEKLNAKKEKILKESKIKKPSVLCKKCRDSGYVSGKICDCVNEIAKQLTFAELSASLPIQNSTFESFDLNYYSDEPNEEGFVPRRRAAAILKLCREFADNFPNAPKSLLFMGGVGLGKTHLSLAIVSKVAEKGYGVVYGSAYNLLSAAEKEHFSYGGENKTEQALLECDLLVIDDLGTEFLSSYTSSLIYNIINTRILTRKPTIINTNFSFDELDHRYTGRIISRLLGSYELKNFIGTDIRQQRALKD